MSKNSGEVEVRRRTITVSDRMQKGYIYILSAPEGGGPGGWKNAATNGANWAPDFKPDLTPAEMLRLGVFGGRYMRDCRDEFPAEWFRDAKLHPEGVSGHSPELNFFGVDASQPLSVWQAKGWIHPDDPRGWPEALLGGIAATIWAAACPTPTAGAGKTRSRSNDGKTCVATWPKSPTIADRATSPAAVASAKPCCIGGMMGGNFSWLQFQ